MYEELEKINQRPRPYEFYTAGELWTNAHTSQKMLEYHLHETIDAASRNHAFIERSVEWISHRFNLSEETNVADFGCGPGLYANRLAKAGAKVTAIDFSLNSLEYAQNEASKKKLHVNYIHSNYLDFETDLRFDLMLMIMCDYCVLSPVQRKIILSKFRSLLKPGGSILLDVYTLSRFDRIEESAGYERNQLNGFWSPNDYYCFVNTFKYPEEQVTLDKYTIFEQSGQRTVYNWLQHYSKDSLNDEFAEAGLKIEAIYADVAGSPMKEESDEMAIVAKFDS